VRKAFLWRRRNLAHIAKHGVSPYEARRVVERASRPYPMKAGQRKWLVRGRTATGRALQVIFLTLEAHEVDVANLTLADLVAFERDEEVIYVIHARDLTGRERRRLRH
jgi:uncharacterized DUF497 family protein